MTVRAVEWKNPYTWGKAIEIDENKVISLRLRDENNLIIWDRWDNEIYVDLQLDDEIRPTDAFPVWITTGRVIIDNGWDKTWTLICAKTTSGDNIKIFYSDDGHLYVDHWTWLFTQVYLKPEVDALLLELRNYVDTELAKKQDKLIAWDNIEIAQDWKTISAILPPLNRFLSLWDCSTGMPISFPSTQLPFEYESWDHFLVETVDSTTNYRPSWTEYVGTASQTVETADVEVWDVYIYDGTTWLLQINHDKTVSFANIAWQPSDNQALAQALNGKQKTLTPRQNIAINLNSEISVDYSWETITISSGSAMLVDTRCKLIPTSNFTLQAPSTVSEGQEYVLRCDNTTAYTMTLGAGFTNPHNVDLTLSANATDQFIFLATPSWDLELQPAQLWAGTGISISNGIINNTLPWAIKSSTPPSNASQWDLWYDTTSDQLNSYDGSSWNPVDIDTTYTGGSGIDIDANNEITVKLAQNSWLWINASDELEVDTSVIQTKMYSAGSSSPSNPSQWDQWYDTTNDELKIYDGSAWNAVWGGGWDVWVSTQANNVFTPWMKIWWWTSANYANLTPDWNTAYLII